MTDKELKIIRFRLTAVYFVILFIIINLYAVASAFINLSQIETAAPPQQQTEVIVPFFDDMQIQQLRQQLQVSREEYREQLATARSNILVYDIALQIFLTVVSAMISYYLAGRTLKPIVDNMRSQEEFIANASHELNTPLTIMKLQSELLNGSASLADYKDLKSTLDTEMARMEKLVTNLLASAKSKTNIADNKWTEVDLKPLVMEVVNRFKPQIQTKKLVVKFDWHDLAELKIKGDSEQIFELLTTIIDNAIKFNREGGEIVISAKATGNKWELQVVDSGIGISQAALAKVFDRFYQEGKDSFKGFGLGLSIAKRIVEAHNGSLSISNRKSGGVSVKILLNKFSD